MPDAECRMPNAERRTPNAEQCRYVGRMINRLIARLDASG